MLSFFPLDVLDEIWDVIESVSEGFLTYSFIPLVDELEWLRGSFGAGLLNTMQHRLGNFLLKEPAKPLFIAGMAHRRVS